jgi:hypothetical protein
MGYACCGCPAHRKWKAKFNELGISDAVYDEAVAVRNVIDDLRKIQDLRAKVDKKLADISDGVKEKFIYSAYPSEQKMMDNLYDSPSN